MPKPENIVPYYWKKGQSGNPNGRPKKYLSRLKEYGYTQIQINDTIRVILSLTSDQLDKVSETSDGTVLEKLIAKALIKSIKNGDLYALDLLLTRTFGYPVQSLRTEEEVHQVIEIKFED